MIPAPDVVRILDQRISVKVVDRDTALYNGAHSGALGASDLNAQNIMLREVGPVGPNVSEAQQVDTLLHEIMHNLFFVCGLRNMLFENDDEAEEKAVGAITPHLLHILRTNPQVVRYLTQALP